MTFATAPNPDPVCNLDCVTHSSRASLGDGSKFSAAACERGDAAVTEQEKA